VESRGFEAKRLGHLLREFAVNGRLSIDNDSKKFGARK
jgi:hypothetical protein